MFGSKKVGVDALEFFRPISLYNLISKVLTMCILKILMNLISEQQNGFVSGRKILNSIIVVHEYIHFVASYKTQGFVMKVDISKAYDRVE